MCQKITVDEYLRGYEKSLRVRKTERIYEFKAVIKKVPEIDGAYVEFPFDIKEEFGKGKVKVLAAFDGVPYEGSIVNMGLKNADSTVVYIIGIRKDIREKIKKQPGDMVHVIIKEHL